VDAANSGLPTGLYLGTETFAGWYDDAILGRMPRIDGQFVSALMPGEAAYVTVDPGVTEVKAWSLAFEPEWNAVPVLAFDVRLDRVVEYTPGVATRLFGHDCRVTNNPFDPRFSPDLVWITTGDCKY
jgi:hypothetical protein